MEIINVNGSNSNMQNFIHTNNVIFSHSLSQSPQNLDPIANKFFRHTNEQHQILIFLSGECIMRTDDYSHVLEPGDICFNPALSYYGINITGNAPYERIVMSITPNERFDKLAYEVFDNLKPINVNLKQELLPYIERYKRYSQALPLQQFSSLVGLLLEELLYICLMKKTSVNQTIDTAETFLKKALAYIDTNWTTIKSIREISNALFISPSYLYEIFNKKLNMPPKAYLMQKRLQAAHAYLISGIPPHEVSQLVGFTTYTAFYRACKSFYGKIPQEIYLGKKEK